MTRSSILGALLVICMFAGGCAPGMENVRIDLLAYQPQPGARATSAPPAKVRIEPVKEARTDSVGSLIGERTTIGNVSMGSIEMNPLPTDVMAQLLRTEFRQMGHSVVGSAEQFTVGARLREFRVITPATAVYWDINGTIELELVLTAQGGGKHDARYTAACTDRTYLYPSEELIHKVVSECVGKIGAELRGDAALAKFMGAR